MRKIIFQKNGFHYDIEKHICSGKFQFAETNDFTTSLTEGKHRERTKTRTRVY